MVKLGDVVVLEFLAEGLEVPAEGEDAHVYGLGGAVECEDGVGDDLDVGWGNVGEEGVEGHQVIVVGDLGRDQEIVGIVELGYVCLLNPE